MSATPQERAPVSIDDDFGFVTEQIEALKELGHRDEAGDVYADEDVYDLSVRWGTALAGRLPRMAHTVRAAGSRRPTSAGSKPFATNFETYRRSSNDSS